MSQPKTKKVDTTPEITETTVKFTRTLIGTFLDKKDGVWTVLTVPFDPETLTMGKPETFKVPGDMHVLEERVYIMQAQNNFYHNEPVTFGVKKDDE